MNSRTAFRRIDKESSSPYRLKNLYCSNHTAMSSQKQIAKAKNPRMVASSSSKVLGTSRETTSSVTAKPKTASENPSMRETSSPRQEKPSSSPTRLRANLPRSISPHNPTLPQGSFGTYQLINPTRNRASRRPLSEPTIDLSAVPPSP